jgi:DNA primase
MVMPALGPGHELAIATLPGGQDPDDLVQAGGRDAIEAVLGAAQGVHDFVFAALAGALGADASPEAVAGLWQQLDDLARSIAHDETRAQYLGLWRTRFERRFGLHGRALAPLHTLTWDEETGEYAFPDTEDDSERRLHLILRELLRLNAERAAIGERKRDLLAMGKAMGLETKALNAVVRDIEADPEKREAHEAAWALYRRVAGVPGPMDEAVMPRITDARVRRAPGAKARRMDEAAKVFEGQKLVGVG